MFPNPPLVSIVIPVFDGERLIGRTLNSARAQTYEPIEIIVVDDGSTDQSAAIAAAVAAHDQRIQLIKQENRGVAAARNLGVKIAQGSLIAPLDADDLWHRDKLVRQVAVMQASPKAGLVYSWAVEIDDNDYVIPPVRNGSTAEGNVFLELVSKAGIIDSGSNPLIRRTCFEAVGGYDPSLRYAEDWQFYLRLAEICEFALVPAHLVGYRRVASGLSRDVTKMAEAMEGISRWIVERRPEIPSQVIQQMDYHCNLYLTHLAITDEQLGVAFRHQIAAWRAQPQKLLSFTSIIFGVRFTLPPPSLGSWHFSRSIEANFIRRFPTFIILRMTRILDQLVASSA